MNIAVLGTGSVGRAIAGRLHELGHHVTVGTRDPHATLARTEPDASGTAPFATWRADRPGVALATYSDAAAGAENLSGKPLVDISNPLDGSKGFPPTLFVKDTDSLGEQVQREFPSAKVVKTLNTLTADLMVHPQALGASTTVFVSGDDAGAKATVTELLTSFGHDDVIDLGGIETARGPEMWLPIWLRLMGALGTAQFNLKIVR